MTSNDDSDRSDESPERTGDSTDADSPERSVISDKLDVPDEQPDPATTSHVLPDEKLQYPEFEFEEGAMEPNGGFDLERSLDRDAMREWLKELRGGIASHDVGVSTPTDIAIFGIGSGDVSMSFDPDDDHRGTLEVTFSLDAKLMTFSDDPEERQAGARGGEGIIPLEMLTSDRDPATFRCYNWIRDPIDRGKGSNTE